MGNTTYYNTNDQFYGGDGNDQIYAYGGDDVLHGEAGNDSLYGQDGSDTLIGGAGNDTLEGGTGGDTYIWNLGDGNDTINNYASSGNSDTDKLRFGEGINPWDVENARSGNDLILSLKDGSGSVKIQNWYQTDTRYKVDEIVFADGSSWKLSDGQSIEDWLQEQAETGQSMAMSARSGRASGKAFDSEMAAAASLLTAGSSADLFSAEMQRFDGVNKAKTQSTAALNAASQAAVDFALAGLQLEEKSAMVCTTEGTGGATYAGMLAIPSATPSAGRNRNPFGRAR
jgi:hypothetical protein